MEEELTDSSEGKIGVETITDIENQMCCVFCKAPTIDEINLGPIYARDGTACHYYCMLFSAALKQTGRDEEGILGFLDSDIYKEVRRAGRLRCAYCRTWGASVGCCRKKCNKAFHFTCGLKHGVNFQFFGQYEAFCSVHSTPQVIRVQYKQWKCPICITQVTHADEPVMANCCGGAVFHKECLKKMALNAGYFFKCPMCNATKVFIDEMRSLGIFVPEQDASWEREPNAFHDLLFQYSKCDAEKCESSKGREYNAAKGGFILARCRICGAAGIHRQCGKLKTVANWACGPCLDVERKSKEEKLKTEKEKPKKVQIIQNGKSIGRIPVTAIAKKRIINPSSTSHRIQPPKNHMNDDEDVDLSKVRISSSCFNYFPYLEDQMALFQKSIPPVVPDHRDLVIEPHVVDWLGLYVRKSLGLPNASSSGLKRSIGMNAPPLTREKGNQPAEKRPRIEVVNEEIPLAPNIPVPKKIVKIRRKYKTSRWRKGVISKRKTGEKKESMTRKAKPAAVVSDASQPMTSRATETENQFVDFDSDSIDKSSAPTLLEGVVKKVERQSLTAAPTKRKVIELGYKMFASGITKEFLVQSNVEIGAETLMMKENDLEIDCTALRPLKNVNVEYCEDTPSLSFDVNCNGMMDKSVDEPSRLKDLTVEKNEEILKHDSTFTISLDHSYYKAGGGNTRKVGKHETETATVMESGYPEEEPACNIVPKKSMENKNGDNVGSSNNSNGSTLG